MTPFHQPRFSLLAHQQRLLRGFIFFSPLGNLLVPSFLPTAFRFAYFFLLFAPCFFVRIFRKELRYLVLSFPFLGYCLLSAYLTEKGSPPDQAFPLARAFLLTAQFFFAFGAAIALRSQNSSLLIVSSLRLYLIAFFLSACLCCLGYCAFYLDLLPLETLARYAIETQFAYGLLRFSPGTYPNEYGVMTSFVLSMLILLTLLKKKLFPPPFWYGLFSLTFLLFLLMTTRAAYLSFVLVLVYFVFSFRSLRLLSLLAVAALPSFNLLSLIVSAVQSIHLSKGSSGIRIQAWLEGLQAFTRSFFLGTGWGSHIHMHNAYFELLVELGIVGLALFLFPLLFCYAKRARRRWRYPHHPRLTHPSKSLADHFIAIGFIHVLSFALTNHNLHHHLTWMTLIFFFHHHCAHTPFLCGHHSEQKKTSRWSSERSL